MTPAKVLPPNSVNCVAYQLEKRVQMLLKVEQANTWNQLEPLRSASPMPYTAATAKQDCAFLKDTESTPVGLRSELKDKEPL